ncbi:hypothetical protein BAUCODRAFT_181170 [Baudoinia panamericana UAMH 10762]|uniref:Asp/Glu/hydantoin racemase n=1 Tax=Baudoinia panamericana (strain UAMH 10762) TaxID=717646 RepID=M2NNB9_BAUPA|nr:uncharacterized protein BAUCODRAFT_181170 [Baudoinia panamericana UAMH 10762]EMD00731.1 hypothetical protein BAUCODRAFT_181170 [Baudoinia panamericana UAMH 10762]
MSHPQRSVLIINPNTTQAMTEGLRPLAERLGFPTHYEYFTAPHGVSSINNEDDAVISAQACLPNITDLMQYHDALLVCCYSQHPLVSLLREEIRKQHLDRPCVTGIFEASVATCLQYLNVGEKFGIVSTGQQWEAILGEAVAELLGSDNGKRFAGTETTGLNANELHAVAKSELDLRMKDATKRLLRKGAKAICLGCAGMAGLDEVVRSACVEALGEEGGMQIKIIDGVISGVVFLEGALRSAM